MLIFSSPWGGEDSLGPQLSVAPDVGAAVDDAAVVAAGDADSSRKPEADSGLGIGAANVARSGGSSFSLRPVEVEKPGVAGKPRPDKGPAEGEELAVSRGTAVGGHAPADRPAPGKRPGAATPVVAANPPAATAPVAPPPSSAPAGPQFVANFENGLTGWSTSALGDSIPRVVTGTVRDGSRSAVVRLTGDQSRSQLVLGGDGGYDGAVQIHEGDEYAFAFSFYIEKMVYGAPGADNLLMQVRSDASEDQMFGLQLWDYAVENGGRGLWSSGEAVSGDRFLGAAAEKAWHDVIVRFKASSQGAGYYEVYLDGQLVDARSDVSLIAAGSGYAQIEVGLFRDGELVQGTSEIRIDAAKFGTTLESVLP
ncbi:MAG TPA: heparin lyase I family protein [Solirubrobacterales bacterium]|nr:heparin lyase I family protein [Solirubrobacterales bacterium]